jgi:ribA/ribD-fused uncharacterized protein
MIRCRYCELPLNESAPEAHALDGTFILVWMNGQWNHADGPSVWYCDPSAVKPGAPLPKCHCGTTTEEHAPTCSACGKPPYHAEPPPGLINDFRGEYRFLSNFWKVDVDFEGTTYPSTEHAYQAAKFLDPKARQTVKEAPKFRDAKRLGGPKGGLGQIREDWEKVKLFVMEHLLEQKFGYPDLRDKLLATGSAYLIEGNNWGDRYWGQDGGYGHNNLGMLLMKIRRTRRILAEATVPGRRFA